MKYDDAFGKLQSASSSYCIGTISSYTHNASQTIAYDADHRLESVTDAGKKRSDGIWRTLITRYEDDDGASIYYKYSENVLLSVIFQHNITMSTSMEYLAVKNAQGDIEAFLNESGEKVVEYAYSPWGECFVHALKCTLGIRESDTSLLEIKDDFGSEYATLEEILTIGLQKPPLYNKGFHYTKNGLIVALKIKT